MNQTWERKRYSIYANGYTAEDQTVVWFWKVQSALEVFC